MARGDFCNMLKWLLNEGKAPLNEMTKAKIPVQKERSRLKHSFAAGDITIRILGMTKLIYLALEYRYEVNQMVNYEEKIAKLLDKLKKADLSDNDCRKLDAEVKQLKSKLRESQKWLDPLSQNRLIVKMVKTLADNSGYVAALHPYMVRPLPLPRPSLFRGRGVQIQHRQ